MNFNLEERKLSPMTDDEVKEHIFGLILIQKFSLRAGFYKYGDCGETLWLKEITQNCDMQTFITIYGNMLKNSSDQEDLKYSFSLRKK